MASKFLLEERSIPVPKELAGAIGWGEATVLQQLYYCLMNPNLAGTEKEGRKWIRNPIECKDTEKQQRAQEHGKDIDWLSNFPFLTVHKIRRLFTKLESLGLVISAKLRAAKWDHCKYYTIDWGNLTELLKSLSLPICEIPTNPFVENQQMDVTTSRKSYQITNSTLLLQNLERESATVKIFTEENLEANANKKLRFDKKQSQRLNKKDCRSGKSSATVEVGYSEAVEPGLPEVGAIGEKSATIGNNAELTEFQLQLEDLGKRLGKKTPVGWAFTIVKNLGNSGERCTYWEEFKAGIPLGASEQQEWEVSPGVACAIAVQCLEQDFLGKPGETPQGAALKTARTIANPSLMKGIWESIKARVMYQKRKWDEQKALGIENPTTFDPWMVPQPKVTFEEAAIALRKIQSALPPVLQPKQETDNLLLTVISPSPCDLVATSTSIESETAESAIDQNTPDGDGTGIAAATKAKIAATLRRFSRPSKQRAVLAANVAEVNATRFTETVKKVEFDDGTGGAINAEEEIW